MSSPPPEPTPEAARPACGCGSGLSRGSCCEAHPVAAKRSGTGAIARAAAAFASGDPAAAEQGALAALEAEPADIDALKLLYDIRAAGGPDSAAFALLQRIVRLDPNDLAATQRLALALFGRGILRDAEQHARNAVRLGPLDPQSHNLMGMVMTEAQRPQVGEHHYRRAQELLGRPSAILLANLAWNLRNQGRMEESRQVYESSAALDSNVFQTFFGWAQMEESDRDFARAGELLDRAERLSPGHPKVLLQRAILHGRVNAYDAALALLDEIGRRPGGLGPLEWSEKGRLLDRMQRHAEAFQAFDEGKRQLREMTGQVYRAEEAADLVSRLKTFFVASRLELLPRATVRSGSAQPIFIVGFPRSGTTMIEQTLSAHPEVSAGDELPVIEELVALIPRVLDSPLPYPEALSDLWLGDRLEGLDNLRDYYLQRARQLGALREGASWFTDKMPLNETHLGLIGLVFPHAPVIQVVRHPLDVVVSVFSNHLTHGFCCASDLESIARHYVLVMGLVEHYRAQMSLKYLRIRYEDVVDRQEEVTREMLAFLGLPHDHRCLDFHENRRYARTASYAQVTEKLYDRSRLRYRAYRAQLEPVIPILEPTIARLGYTID